MGLISKIEDKLSGGSGKTEQSAVESAQENSSSPVNNPATSHLQHPVQNLDGKRLEHDSVAISATKDTANSTAGVDALGGATSSSARDGYSSTVGSKTKGPEVPAGAATGSGQSQGENPAFDAYSTKQFDSTSSRIRDQPTNQTGYAGADLVTQSAHGDLPQQKYTHSTTLPGVTATHPHSFQIANPNHVARTRHGGVANTDGRPTKDIRDNRDGSRTLSHRPISSAADNHGRDAAVAAGIGAGGLGAYKLGRDGITGHAQDPISTPSGIPYGQGETANAHPKTATSTGIGARDVSYMHRQQQPINTTESSMQGGGSGVSAATTKMSATSASASQPGEISQAKRMGAAYEAGYEAGWRDAMEQMKIYGK